MDYKTSHAELGDEEVKQVLRENFSKIVEEVEPTGHLLDMLIEQEVITIEQANIIEGLPTRQERSRHLMKNVILTSNPKSGTSFIAALKQDFSHIHDKIESRIQSLCLSKKQGEGIEETVCRRKRLHTGQVNTEVKEKTMQFSEGVEDFIRLTLKGNGITWTGSKESCMLTSVQHYITYEVTEACAKMDCYEEHDPVEFHTGAITSEQSHITGIKIYSSCWYEGDEQLVIVGFQVRHNDVWGDVIGRGKSDFLAGEVKENEVFLNPTEKIEAVIVASGQLLDSLTFISNLKRKYGPYGGGGGLKQVCASTYSDRKLYLAGICGKVTLSGLSDSALSTKQLRYVQFIFA